MIRSSWTLRILLLLVVAAVVPACGGSSSRGVARSIIVTLTSAATTTEAGGTATFTVRLNRNPNADVTIAVSSNDTGEGTPSTNSLVFTSTNGTVAQTVTVTGQDDAIMDGNIAYAIVLAPAVSTDTRFNGRDPADVNLTNTDNEAGAVIGITVTPTTIPDIIEGGNGSFTVSLDSTPTADVTVPITVTVGAPEVQVSGFGSGGQQTTFNLVLTAGNPSRTVTVHSVEDGLVEGTEAYTITTGDPTSADANFGALIATDVADVTGNVLDDDTTSIVVTPVTASGGPRLATSEAGTTDTFRVRLGTAINGTVTVSFSGLDATEGSLSPVGPLTFTSADAQTNQTVTVTGLDDADTSDVSYTITLTAADTGGLDAGYAGITADVFVTNFDLDGGSWTTLPPGVSPPFSAMTPTPGVATGLAGNADEFEADHPTVVFSVLPDPDQYQMWYRGRTQDGSKADTVCMASSTAPASGWSSNGVVLSNNPNIDWIRKGIGRPSVVHADLNNNGDGNGFDTYIIFYSGRFSSDDYDGIDWATSSNGVNWSPAPPGTPTFAATLTPGEWDERKVTDPCVILDGTTYHMFYAGADASGKLQIGHATTALDTGTGLPTLPWTRSNVGATPALAAGAAGTFSAGGVSAPAVIKDGATWRMWFTANDPVRGRLTIGYAESANPNTGWTVFPVPVVVPDSTGTATWADQNVYAPAARLAAGPVYQLWYSGSGSTGSGIGFISAP